MNIENALKGYKFNIEESDKRLIQFVPMREYGIATKEKPLLLTIGLQSCIALIAYEKNFSFLAHMNTAGDRASDFELDDNDDAVKCKKIDDLYNEIIKNKDKINDTINIGLVLGVTPVEKSHISRQVIEKDLLDMFEKLRINNISAKRIEDINSLSFILDSRNGNIRHDGFENENRITKIVEEEKQPKNEERKIGYHITGKTNLPNISKNGLLPRVGRRSKTVEEYQKNLFFCKSLKDLFIWKERLYPDTPLEDLAILSFDISDVEYVQRLDEVADCFTKSSILPENINVIQIGEEEVQKKITQISFDDISKYSKPKAEIIDELAAYEHKKWSEYQERIHWRGTWNDDGSIEILDEDFDQIQAYSNLSYDQIDEIQKNEIRKKVLQTFYIMQDNNIIDQTGVSEEEMLLILERTEYMRMNRWYKYMLSVCEEEQGKYTIPVDKVQLWKSEMRTKYEDLTEKQKESDKKEVYNIFSEIEKYKNKQRDNNEDVEFFS